jgi:hypothetical protein
LPKEHGGSIITPVLDVANMKQTEQVVEEGTKNFERLFAMLATGIWQVLNIQQ